MKRSSYRRLNDQRPDAERDITKASALSSSSVATSSPGGGAGQGTDSTSGGVSQPGFSFGAATDDEEIAQQLSDVHAMEM